MSGHGSIPLQTDEPDPILRGVEAPARRRLELSINPTDGSLLTASLTQVLLAATDGLYSDLYNMVQGEISVTASAATADDADQQHDDENAAGSTVHQQQSTAHMERMSNLSFAQRRHELSWRLARHNRALQHTAALMASHAHSNTLSSATLVSSTALQHARTAWVQADEAQDALYFFHAQLFPSRAAPHDVYGALDLVIRRHWFDMSRDMLLVTDPYETSPEAQWGRREVDHRWKMSVRSKLLSGEVGWMKKNQFTIPVDQYPQWNLLLRGGLLLLRVGQPKAVHLVENTSSASLSCGDIYPIEALLTVIPSQKPEWTLLSLNIHVQAKTGEFNHQLETSNRQRYDLHRIASLAMTREEKRARKYREEHEKGLTSEQTAEQQQQHVARPLYALFQVAQRFSLSWQLELLSAQAQGLRRGVWAAGSSNPIQVVPVHFFSENDSTLGSMSICFWRIDDSYGSPTVGDLCLDCQDAAAPSTTTSARSLSSQQRKDQPGGTASNPTGQLVLSIRAEANNGIRIALSGSESVLSLMQSEPRVRSTVEMLVRAASDPFALSASDALLAATKLCTEQKCLAVVRALVSASVLPPWMSLSADHGSIGVASRISYHGARSSQDNPSYPMPILFRLMCDGRTGSFVHTFPRSMQLLRRLCGNEIQASELMAVRIASLPTNRRRAAGASSSARSIRDAFDGLIRSMNALGQKAGVGDSWDDIDSQSCRLRERAVILACQDAKISLMKCCALTSVFGLAPLASACAFGLTPVPDMAGGPLDSIGEIKLVSVPPLSIPLFQKLVEASSTSSDGVTKKTSYIEQSLFSLSCSASEEALTVYPLDVCTQLDSPATVPLINRIELSCFKRPSNEEHMSNCDEPPQKRRIVESNGVYDGKSHELEPLPEVNFFAGLLESTLELEIEEDTIEI